MVGGVIFVTLAISTALQRFPNIIFRKFSEKSDTAFIMSWYTIKLRLCYNITSSAISYFLELYHWEAIK